MKYYLGQGLKMWGVYVLFAILSTIFMTIFTFAVTSEMGTNIYSLITAVWFLSKIYSVAWENGKKDGRKEPAHPYNPVNGFVFGLVSVIPSIIILIIYEINSGAEISLFLYNLYLSAFIGFVDGFSKVPMFANIIIYAVIIITSGVGYIIGKRKFSFIETYLPKLIYKQKKD